LVKVITSDQSLAAPALSLDQPLQVRSGLAGAVDGGVGPAGDGDLAVELGVGGEREVVVEVVAVELFEAHELAVVGGAAGRHGIFDTVAADLEGGGVGGGEAGGADGAHGEELHGGAARVDDEVADAVPAGVGRAGRCGGA
jgi:hypothetical protein